MKKDSVNVLNPFISGQDDIGRDITTWPVNYTTEGDFQSLSYTAGRKPYGATDKTTNVLYCRDRTLMARYFLDRSDPNQFNITCRLGFNDNQYIINSILPFRKHMEIYAELVI